MTESAENNGAINLMAEISREFQSRYSLLDNYLNRSHLSDARLQTIAFPAVSLSVRFGLRCLRTRVMTNEDCCLHTFNLADEMQI